MFIYFNSGWRVSDENVLQFHQQKTLKIREEKDTNEEKI